MCNFKIYGTCLLNKVYKVLALIFLTTFALHCIKNAVLNPAPGVLHYFFSQTCDTIKDNQQQRHSSP